MKPPPCSAVGSVGVLWWGAGQGLLGPQLGGVGVPAQTGSDLLLPLAGLGLACSGLWRTPAPKA